MKNRILVLLSLTPVFLIFLVAFSPSAFSEDKGQQCYSSACHTDFEAKIAREIVHMPVKEGKCFSCHNPHTSNHKGLLNTEQSEICLKCHEKKTSKEESKYKHTPFKEGKCFLCHNAHSSLYPKLLAKPKDKICFDCHKEEQLKNGKNKHPLGIEDGRCTICHDPHETGWAPLIKADKTKLCLTPECHTDSGSDKFKVAHSKFSVQGSDCSSCHNPHSSNRKNLLKASLHKPVEELKCAVCHILGISGDFTTLKEQGVGLCFSCHEKSRKSFDELNNHFVGNKKNACLNCHNPHASDSKYLIAGSQEKMCMDKCHIDTVERMRLKTAKSKHPEINICTNCHITHGSNNPIFLAETEEKACTIGECHKGSVGFSHPMGAKAIDKRNNKEMTCITCHDPMGSAYDKQLILEGTKALCEECHRL